MTNIEKANCMKSWISDHSGLIDYEVFKSIFGEDVYKTENAFKNAFFKMYQKELEKNFSESQIKERIKLIKKGEIGKWNLNTISSTNGKIKFNTFNNKTKENTIIWDNVKKYQMTEFKTVTDTKTGFVVLKVYKIYFSNLPGTRYLFVDWKGNLQFLVGYFHIKERYGSTAALKRRYSIK